MKVMDKLDYSAYQLEARKYMKECERLILAKDFEEAHAQLTHAIAELRLMRAALHDHIK
jgi:hypothetical protein